MYVGKVCNACAPKTDTKALTPEQLRKWLIKEGKDPAYVELAVAARKKESTKRRAANAKQSLRKRHASVFEDHLLHIDKLRTMLRNKAKADTDEFKMFYATLESALSQVRREVKERQTNAQFAPRAWQDLINEGTRNRLAKTYEALPQMYQNRFALLVRAVTPRCGG
jgi:hypothetical protein